MQRFRSVLDRTSIGAVDCIARAYTDHIFAIAVAETPTPEPTLHQHTTTTKRFYLLLTYSFALRVSTRKQVFSTPLGFTVSHASQDVKAIASKL